MATRFESPGANAAEAIRKEMMIRMELARQAEMDGIVRQREQRADEGMKLDAELSRERIAETRRQRDIQESKDKRDAFTTRVSTMTPGVVDPSVATEGQELGFGHLFKAGMPQQGAHQGQDEAGVDQYQVTPGAMEFQGTPQQQQQKALLEDPNTKQNVKDFIRARGAAGDEAIPYQLFEDPAQSGGEGTWREISGARASSPKQGEKFRMNGKTGDVVDMTGQPVKERIIQFTRDQDQQSQYFMPIQTNEGHKAFNARTGEVGPTIAGLKPSAGQNDSMINNSAALAQLELLKDSWDPNWMGPAAGRIANMRAAYVGDDPGYARLQTRIASMKNRFIKAITGAQMSEPEATRIMQQLPDVTLPPATNWERILQAEEELKNILELQQQVTSGLRQPGNSVVTEKRLNELFPNTSASNSSTRVTSPKPAPTASGKHEQPIPDGKNTSGAEDAATRAKRLYEKYGVK